jgi:excisionase family DNA binding protein
MTIPRLLSVKDAAAALGLSKETVYRLIYEGRIAHRRTGGRIRFIESDLVEFVEAQKVAAAQVTKTSTAPVAVEDAFGGSSRYR